jgi:riboflavin kinase/FMN adenylyltransferase
MRVLQRLEDCSALPFPVVTIGNFDGVHLGHQAVLRVVRERAAIRRGTVMVLTFDPHPLRVLAPHLDLRFLTDADEKLELLAAAGVDVVVRLPFTQEFAAQSPEDFMRMILVDGVKARELYVGQTFRFGQGRRGTIETLKEAGPQLGFTIYPISPVLVNGVPVSSTRIRDLLQAGSVAEAVMLLGRPYTLRGPVVRGERRGAGLGYPTANVLPPAERVLPADGVYATHLHLEGHAFPAVTYIGVRPTFGTGTRVIETHILEGAQDLYGRTVSVAFHERLRGDQLFDSQELLARQIADDVGRARDILRSKTKAPAKVRG